MTGGFDVAVIGGGIHGASVAEAAAARGYRVVLLERTRPAFGTSSRSSKLIHGGLRYLESGQLGLVAECLRERAILLRRAPELVRLQPFLIPIYRHSARRSWQIGLGLTLYSLLGRFDAGSRFGRLGADQWPRLDGLSTTNLQQVFRYHDAQTDDAALTRAVLASARDLGARIQFPARFLGASRDDPSESQSWRIGYEEDGARQSLQARVLVNAGGPWVNQILARIEPAPAPLPIDWVQGSHIVLEGTLSEGIYYVEAEDRRAVFVMPWQGRILVGTTEVPVSGGPDNAVPSEAEVAYLRRTVARYFPALAERPVLEAFAGLRVLPRSPDKPFSRPRETQFLVDEPARPSLLSIYGGKLTAARATAEQALARLRSELPPARPVADTRYRVLRD